MFFSKEFRTEKDPLGNVKIPVEAYYGSQTLRAIDNFPVSGKRFPRAMIKAQGTIKCAAAKVNWDLGMLPKAMAKAIIQASQEVMEGKWDDHFVIDVYQAGAGTSQNMNVNEVIATRANEIAGITSKKDRIHPNDHVNMSQSTNDTFPSALNMAALDLLIHKLFPSLNNLRLSLEKKSLEFSNVVKSGRTHLHDAIPIRLGQEFYGYAGTVKETEQQLHQATEGLYELGLGGRAIGTLAGLNPDYIPRVVKEVSTLTSLPFKEPENMFSFMQNRNAPIRVMAALKDLAVHLIKITSDLRLLSSGPRTGLPEITLPSVQPGSTIMPGKVNPAILEMTHMVCCTIIGNDTAMTTAGTASQLEINVMMPLMAYTLLDSIEVMGNALEILDKKCISGIEASEEICKNLMEASLALVTGLSPHLGYDLASEIGMQADEENKTIKEVLKERGLLTKKLEKALDPYGML